MSEAFVNAYNKYSDPKLTDAPPPYATEIYWKQRGIDQAESRRASHMARNAARAAKLKFEQDKADAKLKDAA